ncbi:hypothetical protein IPN35_06815 [Candidatus Peregrinibacteria bacterium]|nr:MAG: hypothetical protein IPN35_06815 [Candidatus Peregrinibacteria bacterium]
MRRQEQSEMINHQEKNDCVSPQNLNPIGGIIAKNPPEYLEKIVGPGPIIAQKTNEALVTILDAFSLPPIVDQEELKTYLREKLQVGGNMPDDVFFEKCKETLLSIEKYFTEYLHIQFPKQVLNEAGKIENLLGIFDFLKKTNIRGPQKQNSYLSYYCALSKGFLVEWELQKNNFKELQANTEWFYKRFTEPCSDENYETVLFSKMGGFKNSMKDDRIAYYINPFFLEDNQGFRVVIENRSKTEARMFAKMMKKPNENLKKCITDGIGLRFEVCGENKEEDAKRLIAFIIKNLARKNLISNSETGDKTHLILGNSGLLSEKGAEEIREKFLQKRNKEGYPSDVLLKKEKNQSSDNNVRFFSIAGSTEVPNEKTGESNTSNFEIQIVLEGNRNECGMANHYVYEAIQKMSVVSRLFGSFSGEYLDLICQEAAELEAEKWNANGFGKNAMEDDCIQKRVFNIKKYILSNKKIVDVTHLVPRKNKNGKRYYISQDHFTRWERVGILPDSFVKE